MCVIGTLARGPLSVVAGTRTPVSSTLDRASGGSLLCGPHGRTHELNVLVNRAIGFLETYSHKMYGLMYGQKLRTTVSQSIFICAPSSAHQNASGEE